MGLDRAEASLVCEDKARSTRSRRRRPGMELMMVFEKKGQTSVGCCY